MRTRRFKLSAALGVAAILNLGSASLPSAQAQVEKAIGDKAIELSDTESISASIVALDKQNRTVTLLGSGGELTQLVAGPAVRNFDQIQVGDHVKIAYRRSVALYLGERGTQPKTDATTVAAGAPLGEKPAGGVVGIIDASALVRNIDRTQRSVTLAGHDGRSATVQVGASVKGFDDLRVGDVVHARFTKAIAVSVESAMSKDPADETTFLFVQNAKGVTYDAAKQTLTLEGVSPAVTFFSDRPYRVAGHVMLPGFIRLWSEGADSFKQDPPNASLSIIDSEGVAASVIELANPRLENDRLSYQVVKVLDGALPASGGTCSLFIDGLLKSGVKGAAGGALVGAIAGNAKKGAAIGAGVGVIGGALKK